MPFAFKNAGLLVGTIGTIIIAAICTHCVYVLVASAHELCVRSGKAKLTYADVAEQACLRGPPCCYKYHQVARKIVNVGIFTTYFTVCCLYVVVVALSIRQFVIYYYSSVDPRICIAVLFIPFLLLSYVPNLKYLTPVCIMANVFMGSALGITMYYLVTDLPSIDQAELVADVSTYPIFFCSTVFALQAIGCVMPLENNMKNPKRLITPFGVLNQAMVIITVLHILLGFLGYLRYGDTTEASIILNLPINHILARIAQLLIGFSVFGAFGIQFFICLQIAWDSIKHRYKDNPTLANYLLRTVMVALAVTVALLAPNIEALASLIGAFFFSITGIMIPIFIEMITFWEKGFGRYNWILVKSMFILIVGSLALILGTKDSIIAIIDLYQT
ncbi:hypothetical protein ILUMI_12772 [Ignelater luminosus]|uniref:Amino acid transporter transmembrane domain-containing protein n=1 Tax=Ignelater luminosus TaxID=2038154 RepID=A0A8K0CTG2_IGNLU|nr:hypothetical protein ILUMI_12772 [Ignelater luminosus]